MASTPEQIKRFESNIPKVSTCCCFLELDIGGTLMSVFGVVTGLLYIGRALNILYDVAHYEKEQEDDDALNNDDDSIWFIYISTFFVGIFLLVTSIIMLIGSTKRMAHHIFPFLIAILLSAFWMFVLGTIEVFDSDIKAVGYYAFSAYQVYLWVCAVSLYNQLLEVEHNPQKPTRTDV